MSFRWRLCALVILLLMAAGCDTILPDGLSSIDGSAPTSDGSSPKSTATAEPTPTSPPAQSQPDNGAERIKIWLPPQFDPDANTAAGNLLKSRLEQFSQQNDDVVIEVRVKEVEGSGGILDTLITASAAAKSALPDLVILPHEHLESAVNAGTLLPYDNLSTSLDSTDWFNFAREMAYNQEQIYGLPFAADAQVQVFLPATVPSPISDAAGALESLSPLIFQAGDPIALYTLALYQANGGSVLDENNQPALDSGLLAEVLTFYQQCNESGVMPQWITGYERDEQSWGAFKERRGDQVVTWLSRYLRDGDGSMSLAQIPTLNGTPFALASGWVWALTSPEPEKHPTSVQLAEFLTESSFLAEWTAAMDRLPPRPSSLQGWTEHIREAINTPGLLQEVDTLAQSLHPFPGADLLNSIGGALGQATVDVLKGSADADEAALEAASTVK